MIGTVERVYNRNSWCDIKVAGNFPDRHHPRWIETPAPRDGKYTWYDPTLPPGTRVSFDIKPGTGLTLPGGTFTTEAVAINVQPL